MATRDPGELIRAYLRRVEAAILPGGEVAVARLGTIQTLVERSGGNRMAAFRASDELDALLEGRALDLPPPVAGPLLDEASVDAVASWQAMVLGWLLRGMVAPLGDLGLLCVHDDVRTTRDELLGEVTAEITGQTVGFRPAPQLTAAINGAPAPPPVDSAALAEILRAHNAPPLDVASAAAMLERLGFTVDEAATAPAGTPPLLGELIRRVGARELGTLRVLGKPGQVAQLDASAVPFAIDQRESRVWAYCTLSGDDPGVILDPVQGGHVCALHRTTVSSWLTARLLAVEIDTLAPAAMPEDALAAIAAELEPFGRIGGELAQELWRHPRWQTAPARARRATPPPPPPARPSMPARPPLNEQVQLAAYADDALVIAASGLELHVSSGGTVDVLAHESKRAAIHHRFLAVAAPRLQDALVAQGSGGFWLRLVGCFHGVHQDWKQDGVRLDIGPVPQATAQAAALRLRVALGLPREFEPIPSTAELIGQYTRRWVEVVGKWNPTIFERPGFDGVYLRLPTGDRMPSTGQRLRIRGVFEGPRRLPPGPRADKAPRDPGTLYAQHWAPA